MTQRNQLRLEYLRNVCEAFTDYLEAGNSLHIRSDHVGNHLEITIAIEDPDTFHDILEAKPHPTSPNGTP